MIEPIDAVRDPARRGGARMHLDSGTLLDDDGVISLQAAAALAGVDPEQLAWDCCALGEGFVSGAEIAAVLCGASAVPDCTRYLLAIVINERLLDLGLTGLLDPRPASRRSAAVPAPVDVCVRAARARASAAALHARAGRARRAARRLVRAADRILDEAGAQRARARDSARTPRADTPSGPRAISRGRGD